MPIKIASWNVNSIKARLEHVKNWLAENKPDILMMQELKGLDFPSEALEELGYTCNFVNQKAYNGVASLSLKEHPATIILDKLPGDDSDEQARYVEIDYKDIRVINIYLPNGNPVDTDKYTYKLGWMDRLYTRLKTLREEGIPFIIGGDFNVIPDDIDCHDPKGWAGDALFRPETHAKWHSLLNLGLTDSFRVFNHNAEEYSFWDYQRGAWQQNHGIRIDHFLASPTITDRLVGCKIDKNPRGLEKASDHTPIIVEIADN